MNALIMARTYVDISKWWPRNEKDEPLSVYAVHQQIVGTENEVSRYTLTRAKEGVLEKGDFSNLKALGRLCSLWSGKNITLDDLVVEDKKD